MENFVPLLHEVGFDAGPGSSDSDDIGHLQVETLAGVNDVPARLL
jgi:hypothetical protein